MQRVKWLFLLLTVWLCSTFQLEAQSVKRRLPRRNGQAVVMAPPEPPVIVRHVEERASFPGGRDSLARYLQRHIRYPMAAREDGIQGTVTCRFTLDEAGRATKIELLRDIGGGCGKEALRVLQQMPAWRPFRYDGKVIPYIVTLSIPFRITE